MNWDDRNQNGGPWSSKSPETGGGSGLSRFFRRIFENPENPLGWSVFMFRFAGITVRAHLIMIIFISVMLLRTILESSAWWYMAIFQIVAIFGLVTIHEFGHCFAARWSGGAANRIVLLPWGGLALTMPADGWRAHFITTVGGPLVHLLIFPLTTLALLGTGHADAILFNPFDFNPTLSGLPGGVSLYSTAILFLWYVHAINIILFGFNVFFPMFPMDGGRMVQELLWAKLGYRRSMEVAILIGFFGAMVLAGIGLVIEQTMLVIIAIFGALFCWQERQRIRAGAFQEADEYGLWASLKTEDRGAHAPSEREVRKARKKEERETLSQEELDRILAKIATDGMGSLTRREKRILEGETKKRRGE